MSKDWGTTRHCPDLLATRNIPLTIVVYPWAQQIAQGDRNRMMFEEMAKRLF
jgi:hypothetical protein